MKTWVLVTALVGTTTAHAQRADELARVEAEIALRELRVEDAERLLGPLARSRPRDPNVLHALALLHFHKGRYEEAASAMEASITADAPRQENDPRPTLLGLMQSTRDATRGWVESRSDDGRFVVRHAPGRDRHLVDYALRALEGADRALEAELGFRMPGPVRLELYPHARALASVSTLSVEAIERTGTIALCKWDKLMVTSPRALLRGYPWMDTIAHEYVHLVLTRVSRDNAPVWFQEGVAKFLERRWRMPEARPHLSPASRGLLRRAHREDRLLSFDQIHPSIALLPSQEDAALAFAQVSTFVARYYAQHGASTLRAAIARMASGTDARDALARAAGKRWSELEADWIGSLDASTTGDAPSLLPMRLREGDAEADETPDVTEGARRPLRLGDLLWGRRRFRAAAVEYERALSLAPGNPIVASRLARAAVEGGTPERAVAALTPVVAQYPEHAPTQAVLARAKRLLGDAAGAREAAAIAIRLNPFDPSPHCDLAEVAESGAERAAEADRCRALGGSP
ncbi:MAG: tetratricopeptide repeat protein [Myxococcota bacterium]